MRQQSRAETSLPASKYFDLSAITETTAKVLGDSVSELETHQDFTEKGTAVLGGTAQLRTWTDKSFIPITLDTQCVDCMHCVVACPHHSIYYESTEQTYPSLLSLTQKVLNATPWFDLDPRPLQHELKKGVTNYSHCKGCFVCASACPTDAIHFVPKDSVNREVHAGGKIQPEDVEALFLPPEEDKQEQIESLLHQARQATDQLLSGFSDPKETTAEGEAYPIFNGSQMLCDFVFQAEFDCATMFPITPNTSLLKLLETRVKKQDPDSSEHYLTMRTCLSEESGYAYLTGFSVQGKRTIIAQGSQSLAQMYEFMNINPGLHLPVFLLELTRSLSPGTAIKPDHTTTLRTSNTGEIVLFGRSLQDNYDKSLLLLKLMETDRIWIPGRLVIKGFVETHTLSTTKQAQLAYLTDEQVHTFLGRPKNPFVFTENEDRSVGILDFDARYAEQRLAIDNVLLQVNETFDQVANQLSAATGRPAIAKVDRYPKTAPIDLAILSLNDPDLSTAEWVADDLRRQGINCGVISINLYRPFPAEALREAVAGCRAVAILEYDNWSGQSGGGVLSQEVRGAFYELENPPKTISIQVGLGGRATTVPYLLNIYRMLADLSSEKNDTATHRWLKEFAPSDCFAMGARGVDVPSTDQTFDVPITQPGVEQLVIVGKGGQGLMMLQAIATGFAAIKGKAALSMVGYGALQRGGGVTVSLKLAEEPIQDFSDIVIADTLLAFDDDIHLEVMLEQLRPGGTLVVDTNKSIDNLKLSNLPDDCKVIAIPAKEIALKLYNNSNRTNMVLLGALFSHLGVQSCEELSEVIRKLAFVDGLSKHVELLKKSKNLQALMAGFLACQENGKHKNSQSKSDPARERVDPLEMFSKNILPAPIYEARNHPQKLAKIKKRYALKKKIYQWMFKLHPMVNKIQSMYLDLGGSSPVSAGDMACPGCGQINIFRTVFNYLGHLHKDQGKFFVSEQDGCGTVFSGMNRTSIWNLNYIRIAFETAHGVAAGLAHAVDNKDIVVSISGDGGMMQGIRSVEDTLHHQDPIFHIIVANQTLGNTGGQATVNTMAGARTREDHISKHQPLNLLKYAEKYQVQGGVASTVNLHDLYKKIQWGYRVVMEERKPFVLLLNFSCLEQGMNLARSLGAQKMALDARYFVLHSLKYKDVKNRQGKVLYRKANKTIDWYPWVFGRRNKEEKLKEYCRVQKMMSHLVDNQEEFELTYWQLESQWQAIKDEMGPWRYYWGFLKNCFSVNRATMARIIRKKIPPQAEL